MATLNAQLTRVTRQAENIQIEVSYTLISDSSQVATKILNYTNSVAGSQILADVRTAGSVYIDAVNKTTALTSMIGTVIQI